VLKRTSVTTVWSSTLRNNLETGPTALIIRRWFCRQKTPQKILQEMIAVGTPRRKKSVVVFGHLHQLTPFPVFGKNVKVSLGICISKRPSLATQKCTIFPTTIVGIGEMDKRSVWAKK
jgi:hypothetical protein